MRGDSVEYVTYVSVIDTLPASISDSIVYYSFILITVKINCLMKKATNNASTIVDKLGVG